MRPPPLARAVAIARPSWRVAVAGQFKGTVTACFSRACTIVDGRGRLMALTEASLGKGPFAIVLDAGPDFFSSLKVGDTVDLDIAGLSGRWWRVSLDGVPL